MTQQSACHFEQTGAETRACREQSLAFLDHHGLPVTPVAYAIAFDYSARRTPALRKELNQQLMRGEKIDTDFLEDVFQRHFLVDAEAGLESHLANIHTVLYRALQGMAEASKGMCDFGDVLQDQLEELQNDPRPSVVTGIVERLSAATEKAIANNKKLRLQMKQAQQESEQLRRELVQAKQEAVTDGLTNLLVRKAFDAALEEQVAAAAEANHPLSMLMLDIDKFKRINDTFGHPLGDEVIRSVAAFIRKHVRGTDISGRYGGEEFAVLLPDTDLPGALTVAGTVHRAIGRMVLVRKGSRERLPAVTVSVGVVVLRKGETGDSLVERADQCLYAAKQSGRNRVMSESHLAGGSRPGVE